MEANDFPDNVFSFWSIPVAPNKKTINRELGKPDNNERQINAAK